MGIVYMLQFDTPLGNDKHRAHYYLGYCKARRLDERIAEHKSGYGARITAALAVTVSYGDVWRISDRVTGKWYSEIAYESQQVAQIECDRLNAEL